jgi:hypothetical protein
MCTHLQARECYWSCDSSCVLIHPKHQMHWAVVYMCTLTLTYCCARYTINVCMSFWCAKLACTHIHFVAITQHCILPFCNRRLLHRLMAEAVTVAEGTSSSSSSGITGDSSSQRLLQAQRQFHTDIKRYQPLFAQVNCSIPYFQLSSCIH